MDWSLLYLLPLLVAVILIYVAFRAHERFWNLGFLGWRKVYAGLGAYLAAGIISGILYWVIQSAPGAGVIPWLQAGLIIAGAAGILLILAGSIERLHEISAEHAHLEDVRAGFDLFDSLREIIAQPYAFLEVLDYALKEMVRAAGVDSGGLWLYNQSKSEWVLTGWANMSEKLRQQTESVKGSGTGFDRMASAHKARLFVGADNLRVAFPEWEAEGFQSILGLPLVSGAVGSAGRQLLGAIVLADESPHRFDDDRARRLYAASDYVAAVIAEARIVRQLDSSRHQLDAVHNELEREREAARRQKEEAEAQLLALRTSAEQEKTELETVHRSRLEEQAQRAQAEQESLRQTLVAHHQKQTDSARREHEAATSQLKAEHEERLKAEAARADELRSHWQKARQVGEELEKRLASERANWERRLDQLHTDHQAERTQERERYEALAAKHQEYVQRAEQKSAELEKTLAAERRQKDTYADELSDARETLEHQEMLMTEQAMELDGLRSAIERLHTDLETEKRAVAGHIATLENTKSMLQDRESALVAERKAREDMSEDHRSTMTMMETRLANLEAELERAHQDAAATSSELQSLHQQNTELEKTAAEDRQSASETIATLRSELNDAVEQLAQLETEANRENESLRGLIEDREQQLESWRQAHREAADELRAIEEQYATSQQAHESALALMRDEVVAEVDRRTALEQDFDALRAEWTSAEERHQRELVEERLNHRRTLHSLEFESATMRERLQRTLTLPTADDRVESLMQSAAAKLPDGARLYLWRRGPNGDAQMIGWLDAEGGLRPAESLAPWSFELETIPAEGTQRLIDSFDWARVRGDHQQAHLSDWSAHWVPDTEPTWAVCWPWGSNVHHANGWLTAFGFGNVAPSEGAIDQVEDWVSLLAGAVVGLPDHEDAAPMPATTAPVDDGDEHDDLPDLSDVSDEDDELAPLDETDEVDPEAAEDPAEDQSELHHVILSWAANQTEDALRLDLTAQPGVNVNETWLLSMLERGRVSCRGAEGLSDEFIVSTLRRNGHTILRLLRGPETDPQAQQDIAAVEDQDLSSEPETSEAADAEEQTNDPQVSGRWLVRDGSRIGMELRFNMPKSEDVAHHEPVGDGTDAARTVLVLDDDPAMVDLLHSMLNSLGVDTFTAFDRDEAQAQLRMLELDAVIVNANMDGGNGWGLASWFKEANPQLPTILVVGAETLGTPEDFPGDWMLRLPFQIEELRECLDLLIAMKA